MSSSHPLDFTRHKQAGATSDPFITGSEQRVLRIYPRDFKLGLHCETLLTIGLDHSLLWRAALCPVGCLSSFLGNPLVYNKKCFQTWPQVPDGGGVREGENVSSL